METAAAMGHSQALPFLLLLCLEITLCFAGVPGTEFITAFMQNHNRNTGNPTLSLSITALQDSTTVNVRINTISATSFNPKFTLNKLEEKTISLPSKIQLMDSGSSSYVVSVSSNNPVSVVSINFKEQSSDSASLFPVTELGTEYYIVTPLEGSFKEFAIIAKEPATLTIFPTGLLAYSGKNYGKGNSFKFTLESYQAIQFQSEDDLSGTKVLSNKPVAVLSGHTCSLKFTKCNHVYEQLQPTFIWGTMFFIPTVSFQTKYDLVYVTAAAPNTLVTYQAGSLQKSEKLDAGDVMELQLKANAPLVINSTDGIQVIHYVTGGYKGTVEYDTVLMTVPDVTSFCTSFQTLDLEDFSNEAIVVAKTTDLESITVNKASLRDVRWNTIQGTEYSWGEFPLTPSSSQHVFESSKSPFSLSVFGIANLNAFGEGATCLGGSSRPSCSQVTCRKKEVCKIDHGKATCQGTGEATCWAWGDPHYHTFDGKNYDFQGTCSYTMSKTCDPELPFFNIETVNENRGSSLVSYLKSVNIQVYNYNITGIRSEFGVVRVNNQLVQLPLYLNNNKLILLQSGTSLILKTDFKLKVIYDWNILLKITVPSTYYGSVCGLCGNYNDNSRDDLSKDGETLTPIAYSQLWKVKETSDANCHDDCNGECVTCTNDKKKLYGNNQYCGILTQSNGPFKACRDKVDSIYKDNCIYDMCLNNGYKQILCQTLKAYSDACAREGIQVEDWRNITDCPMDCPGNSTYNPCGSACPATCLDSNAPSTCTEPCLEVCECDPGFVMIEGECQPKRNCGCFYKGRSINPGDSFWDDPYCSRKCFCNPSTRKVECNNTKCANGEKCLVIDGIQDCYPTKYKTCSASGDPHYVTFDDFHYDFQGSCQYLLSGLCKKRNDLSDFEVIALNQNQGSLLVSYTTAVTFKIFGIEIQIRREFPATVLVDGIKSNIPFKWKTKLGNIDIFQSGRQCIVQTNIGIRVTFDWEARVGVTLPSTYSGFVCGLCGNYNGNPTDDVIDSDGNPQPDLPLFGHSWREGPNADQCKIPIKPNCTGLLRLEEEQKKTLKECGMVLDKKGPFKDCHSKINPESYFKDCVYDMCEYGKRQDLICRLLSGYAAACQDAGAVIYNWRSDFVCPLSCPLNSRYNVCVSGCPSTCLSLSLSTKCDNICREGCECQAGYVFSGTECVPLSQCGCLYNSQYFKPGDIFYPENTCENKCTCNNGGTVTCAPTSCGPYEQCSIVKGVQSCNPVGTAVCSSIGRTTFNTFDNFGYDFNGNCSYILSETCLTEGSQLTPYVIRIRNIDGSISTSKKVILEVYNYNVTFLQGNENKILVNDILRNIPFELEGSSLRADYQGGGLVLKTIFGLIITVDNAFHVTIPATYHNQTCGLCGNYNDDIKDDLSPYDDDVESFADSWKEQEEFCVTNNICTGVNQTCPDCPRSLRKMLSGNNFCGILSSPNGPFSPCHAAIDPKVYQTSCVNTLCTKTGELCTILQGYAKLCQDTGIAIKPWRTPSFCPYTCSQENSHYEQCADVCSTSCSSLYDLTICPTTCSEGCQCDTGYFFQNGLCVTPDMCDRCILNSTFYKVNQTIISEDCSQSCTCTSRHVMVCEPYSCASDEICTVLDGQVQCINKDPCKSVTCRSKEHCETNDGNVPVCVPDYTRSCTVWGDPHFTTFDGYNFDFHGTCTYILAAYVGSDATLEYFRIEERNDNRENPSSASVRLINIFAYNFNISMLKDEPGQVRVNGEILNLPLINDKLTIAQSGLSTVLKTAFGLRVEYDYDLHLEITIPSTYHANIGGLCGNFNGNSRDDKLSPDNKQMTVVTKWAMSWKVSDGDDFCWDICHGNCAECNETLKTLYEGEEYCGLLEADDGPFKDCYDTVRPSVFFNNCVKDVCSHNGLGLCQAFEAYVTACRKEGVLIQDWRNITECNMNCPENSHYQFCGTACQATCLDKNSPDRCTEPCRETCQCNEGYVFSAGQCIDVTTCGCIYKDLYYKPNQEFWLDDKCSVHCKCDPILGMVVCKETKCQDTERCMLRGGVRDCYPVSYSTCISTGDPHYTTFDGRKYDFMGTCTYQLTGLGPSVNPNLTPFQVKVQNDKRASKTVSYTKSLTLEVYNQTITLTRDYPHRVLVNGVAKFLPLSLESNRIKAFMRGEHAFIRTDFEITINYNWENYGRVMVPNTYAEALSGLCGNFNQDPSDDLIPKGPEDLNNFEEKYRVGEETECKAGCVGECPDCSTDDTLKYSDKKYCGIIKMPDGPLSQCFNVIDPTSYFTDCLYDSCLSGGQYSAICGAIAQYVSECQEKGVSINNWRKYTICEPICPLNSHYEICGPGCHATCSNLNSASDCQKSCTEGCYCDSGFVLSGDTCVPFSECGCDYNGTYYQRGQTFYLDKQCNEQCQCTEDGSVECQATSCNSNEECKIVNGAIGCHSKTTKTCLMTGNRHFATFDGLNYDLQGSCSYTLAEVNQDLKLENFSIVAHSGSFGRDNIVGTQSLQVNVHGHEIIIDREAQWTVKVNEESRMLPLIMGNNNVKINQEGSSIVIQTDFGLVVHFDTINSVQIAVPSAYKGAMGGLCGDLNGHLDDDLRLPSGQMAATAEEFGTAWRTNGDCYCKDNCKGCDDLRTAIFSRDEACGLLLKEDGPFADCYGLVNVTSYFNQCLFDMCASDGQAKILCQSLQAYVTVCQTAGAKIQSWRSSNFCSLECPLNSHYELCTHTCDVSCSAVSAPASCSEQCSEGCQCDDGYLFDANRCVSMENCGCFHNGRYYNLGDSVVSSDCLQRCTCYNGGIVECVEFNCSDDEYCGLQEGKQGCINKRGTCTLSGSGSLVSFDNVSGSVVPDNTFDLAAVCHDAESWFRIVVIPQSCAARDKFDVSAVHVYFSEFSVALRPDGKAWLNGRTVSLPLMSGAVTIESTQEGFLIKRGEDFELTMGESGDLTLNVHQKFSGSLCGACGNFNRKKSDDLQTPGGKSLPNFSEFIVSVTAQDFTGCDSWK